MNTRDKVALIFCRLILLALLLSPLVAGATPAWADDEEMTADNPAAGPTLPLPPPAHYPRLSFHFIHKTFDNEEWPGLDEHISFAVEYDHPVGDSGLRLAVGASVGGDAVTTDTYSVWGPRGTDIDVAEGELYAGARYYFRDRPGTIFVPYIGAGGGFGGYSVTIDTFEGTDEDSFMFVGAYAEFGLAWRFGSFSLGLASRFYYAGTVNVLGADRDYAYVTDGLVFQMELGKPKRAKKAKYHKASLGGAKAGPLFAQGGRAW